jgi:hypothetical protein
MELDASVRVHFNSTRLIANADLRQSLAERAFHLATARCNSETNVRQLETFLAGVRVCSNTRHAFGYS